ncbi:MAG: hypothetical protein IJ565_03080 [Bacilli bacterium]|nr:hypothetical protein [Bacilli bacterium]
MKIEILYSEVANLFGDMANIKYLEKCLPKAKFIYTSLNEKPRFIKEKINLVYMGPMSENSQELVIKTLSNYKKEIKDAIKNNVNFLITGNAIEIFGKYIENEDGTKIKGLGLFEIYSKRKMMKRYNSIELGTFEDLEIVGFKSSFTEIYGNAPKFLDIVRGYGNSKDSKVEGIKKNNFIATTLLGPILVINPFFTKYLFKKMGIKSKLAFENETIEAYNKRLEEFKDMKRELD